MLLTRVLSSVSPVRSNTLAIKVYGNRKVETKNRQVEHIPSERR